jgi:hypothetical protein
MASPRKQALRLMRRIGMAHSDPTLPHVPYFERQPVNAWDGKQLHLYLFEESENEDGVFHEIGHWMLASTVARKVPDFGLGPATESRRTNPPRMYTPKVRQDIESRTSILGIELQWRFRLEYATTMQAHSWGRTEALHWDPVGAVADVQKFF